MRKILMLLCCITLFAACKNAPKDAEVDSELTTESIIEIQAEFIYIQDAAVLKGKSFIYGVELDDKAKELAEQVKKYKKDQYDMVPVVVKGLVKPNPVKDGWKEIVEIQEILKVLPVKKEAPSEAFKVNVNQ